MIDSQSSVRSYSADRKDEFRFKKNCLAIDSEMLAYAANAGPRTREAERCVQYDLDGSLENPVSQALKNLEV